MKTGLNGKRGLVMAIIGIAGSVFGIDAPTGLSVAQIDYTQISCNIDIPRMLVKSMEISFYVGH